MLHAAPLDPLHHSFGMQSLVHRIAKGTVEIAVENKLPGGGDGMHCATLPNL
jgi:hypothetical protein